MFDLRGLHGLKEEYDLVIVGAGLSGAVVAEQAKITSIQRKKVMVIDNRPAHVWVSPPW